MSNINRLGSLSIDQNDPASYRLDFGPYKGYTLREIYRTDPAYVRKLAKERRGNLAQLIEMTELLEGEPVRTERLATWEIILVVVLIVAIVFFIIAGIAGM